MPRDTVGSEALQGASDLTREFGTPAVKRPPFDYFSHLNYMRTVLPDEHKALLQWVREGIFPDDSTMDFLDREGWLQPGEWRPRDEVYRALNVRVPQENVQPKADALIPIAA